MPMVMIMVSVMRTVGSLLPLIVMISCDNIEAPKVCSFYCYKDLKPSVMCFEHLANFTQDPIIPDHSIVFTWKEQ